MQNKIDTSALRLSWYESPWDTAVFNAPVYTIDRIEVLTDNAGRDAQQFMKILADSGAHMASCRLPHDHLVESMLLEDLGFRFVEMIYQPVLDKLLTTTGQSLLPLAVAKATAADLFELTEIAGNAFANERFHIDPRLPRAIGDKRYQNWVRAAIEHPNQQLQVLRDSGSEEIIGFFIIEHMVDGTCYWHLNAISPKFRGRGIGRRAWSTMLKLANTDGAHQIRTSVVARNVRVLNLYASLGFRLEPPAMTFHWVSPTCR